MGERWQEGTFKADRWGRPRGRGSKALFEAAGGDIKAEGWGRDGKGKGTGGGVRRGTGGSAPHTWHRFLLCRCRLYLHNMCDRQLPTPGPHPPHTPPILSLPPVTQPCRPYLRELVDRQLPASAATLFTQPSLDVLEFLASCIQPCRQAARPAAAHPALHTHPLASHCPPLPLQAGTSCSSSMTSSCPPCAPHFLHKIR